MSAPPFSASAAAFQQLMADAARRTREGGLSAAAEAIRSALWQAPGPNAEPAPAPSDAGTSGPNPARAGRFIDSGLPSTTGPDAAGRSAKLYLPRQTGDRPLPLPLVVMLHGCTQHPDDFAAGTRMNALADRYGFYVLYPAQSQKMNPQRCWNWFKHSHQQRDRGEPAWIVALVDEVAARHPIDRQRIHVAGLSAGGAMAAVLGAAYPDRFACVGVHSGLAAGAATALPGALQAMQSGSASARSGRGVPTIVFHGDADATVHARNGDQVIAAVAEGTVATATAVKPLSGSGRAATRTVYRNPAGACVAEHWRVHGAGHAWAGGAAAGSYTDASGPDASAEMVRFFLAHPRQAAH